VLLSVTLCNARCSDGDDEDGEDGEGGASLHQLCGLTPVATRWGPSYVVWGEDIVFVDVTVIMCVCVLTYRFPFVALLLCECVFGPQVPQRASWVPPVLVLLVLLQRTRRMSLTLMPQVCLAGIECTLLQLCAQCVCAQCV
jgi:hypothetical protein